MQDQLVRLIMRVLIQNKEFFYYQGYHDICVTFLLILGEELAFHVVNKLSKSHLNIYMEKTMEATSDELEFIPILLDKESPSLGMFLRQSGVGTIFSLSWVITWFSHVLRNYDNVGRFFDLFICSHRFMPMYLSVAMLLYKEDEILRLDCDMAPVHQYLTRLLENEEDSLPMDILIRNAKALMAAHPPEQMKKILDNLAQKKRKEEAARKRSLAIKQLFSVRAILGLVASKYGMASVLVVFAAVGWQMFWSKKP